MNARHLLERQQFLPWSLPEVFDFFAGAENLELITPAWLNFKVLSLSTPSLQCGTLIHYLLRWHGLPLHWTSRIVLWDPPHAFIDEQLSGPYRLWHHEHRFYERPGGTLTTDRVRYSLPLGFLGSLAHSLRVRREVEAIFDFRERVIARRFGGC